MGADITVIETGDWRLPKLSGDINAAINTAEHSAGAAVVAARRAGTLLLEAKKLVPHGQWEDWLTDNCTVAVRTAQAYMRLASRLPELPAETATAVAQMPLREAVRAISTAPTAPPRVKGSVRLSQRTDRERARDALAASAKAISAVKRAVAYGFIQRSKIDQARKKLLVAIEALDKLERADDLHADDVAVEAEAQP